MILSARLPADAAAPTVEKTITDLRRVRLTTTPGHAELVVDYNACDRCGDRHDPSCGHYLALGLLPSSAVLTGSRYNAASQEVQQWAW